MIISQASASDSNEIKYLNVYLFSVWKRIQLWYLNFDFFFTLRHMNLFFITNNNVKFLKSTKSTPRVLLPSLIVILLSNFFPFQTDLVAQCARGQWHVWGDVRHVRVWPGITGRSHESRVPAQMRPTTSALTWRTLNPIFAPRPGKL